jgi:hypothetical protein
MIKAAGSGLIQVLAGSAPTGTISGSKDFNLKVTLVNLINVATDIEHCWTGSRDSRQRQG